MPENSISGKIGKLTQIYTQLTAPARRKEAKKTMKTTKTILKTALMIGLVILLLAGLAAIFNTKPVAAFAFAGIAAVYAILVVVQAVREGKTINKNKQKK